MADHPAPARGQALFRFAVSYPWLVVVLSVILIGEAASFLPMLVTDTRPNAFLAPGNPALVYREMVREQFGLSNPLVIAIANFGEHGVYEPETLELV